MKIVIINKSDCIGGAAVVSHRLMQALALHGEEVSMLVMKADGEREANIEEYGNNSKGKRYFLAERLNIFLNNKFSRKNLFKVSTAKYGSDISEHRAIKEADVILLNWINQGALSWQGIENICKLKKPVIWTMHDMWQCTGICHHALECNRYKEDCGKCQYLGSVSSKDLSAEVANIKRQVYTTCRNLHFVAVSNWLAKKCGESGLMSRIDVKVIPNAFPVERFSSERLSNIEGVESGKKVIAMGAARLDDPIKGFDYMIDALNDIADNRNELAKSLHIILYGNIRNGELLERIKLPYTYLGSISMDKVAQVYSSSDIVVSTSLYETLPGTLIEGAASGCVPVTFGNGGQTDIVEHKKTGYIARYKSAKSIADGIEWAVVSGISREMLRENITRKFASSTVAQTYIDYITTLLATNK
ncbi:MAG: glycosyltransferase [Muribaculaceae bacterium]|nr:glycosyltransferase [Muribaculaceae bacterium]